MKTQTMSPATLSFRVDGALRSQAAEHDAWFRRAVRAGIESANAGELIAAEDVETEAVAWRAETRSKVSGSGS